MPQLHRCVVHWLVAALAVAPASFSAAAGSAPVRVASLNLCTDQLLLALADQARSSP